MHPHQYSETIVNPNCTEAGYTLHRCSVCGFSYKNNEFPANGHSAGDWIVESSATCSAEGVRNKKCTVCNEIIKTEVVPAIDHKAGEWVTTKVPTCENVGKKEQKCSVCNEVIAEEVILPVGHNYSTSTVDPICGEQGYTQFTCSVCGDSYRADFVEAIEHSYGSWSKLNDTYHQRVCGNNPTHVEKANHTWNTGVVTTEAKCETAGVRTYTCTVCNATKTETINALGHTSPDGNGNYTYCGKHLKDVDSGNNRPAGACKYCGEVHGGVFGWLIKFFHSILVLFGLRK